MVNFEPDSDMTQAAWKENAKFSQQESNVAHYRYDLQFTNPNIPVLSAGSRLWDKGVGGWSPKKFFPPFRPQFGLKIREAGLPGPSPWMRQWF